MNPHFITKYSHLSTPKKNWLFYEYQYLFVDTKYCVPAPIPKQLGRVFSSCVFYLSIQGFPF